MYLNYINMAHYSPGVDKKLEFEYLSKDELLQIN